MKKLYFIVFILYFSLFASGQANQMCATPTPTFDVFEGINLDSINNANRMSDFNYNVKVFVHILRNTNGTNGVRMFEPTIAPANSGNYNFGDTIPSVHDELQNLANYFSTHDICFTLVGWEYINDGMFSSGLYWDGTPADPFANLLSSYPEVSTDVIDIYILPQDCYYRGRANGIPSTALVMYAGRFEWVHIAHEMGHCLELYHTFEPAFGIECPDGSNCSTAGDKVCDTPADDNGGWSTAPCQYNGGGTVFCNGVNRFYSPLSNNAMSYAPFACRNSFTAGQRTRMAATLTGVGGVVSPAVSDYLLMTPAMTWLSGYSFYTAINTVLSNPVGSTVTNSAKVTFTAGDVIELQSGFIANPGNGGYFNASINQICGN